MNNPDQNELIGQGQAAIAILPPGAIDNAKRAGPILKQGGFFEITYNVKQTTKNQEFCPFCYGYP